MAKFVTGTFLSRRENDVVFKVRAWALDRGSEDSSFSNSISTLNARNTPAKIKESSENDRTLALQMLLFTRTFPLAVKVEIKLLSLRLLFNSFRCVMQFE